MAKSISGHNASKSAIATTIELYHRLSVALPLRFIQILLVVAKQSYFVKFQVM